MPLIPLLFVLQVPSAAVSSSNSASTQGSVVCTQPIQKVYLLSFSAPPDNRLTPSIYETILLALDILEYRLLAFIKEMELVQKAQGESYGRIKEELYREIVGDLGEGAEWAEKEATRELERSKRELDTGERVGEWEALMDV
jgi:hypothetical protein